MPSVQRTRFGPGNLLGRALRPGPRVGRPRSGGLRQVRAWIPGPRASCPRTARSAVPPRDRCPLGKPLFPARPRPGSRGGGSHETNSNSPDGERMPTAQSRAGRPRSGGLRQVRAWIPGPRASCPRTARSAVPPRDRCPLGKPLFPARPRPGGRGGGSHETNSNSPDGGRMPTAQSRAGRPRSGGLRQVRAWIPGPRASRPRTARSAVPPRDRCPLGKPLFPARPRPGGRGGGSHETNSNSPDGGRMPTAQSRAGRPRSGGLRQVRAWIPGPRASRPRTARSAVPPRDRCPLGKPLFPARPRPGGRGGGSHETNSNSPDGGRMPTAQSRAGRPRSGGLRQVRAWIPGPRASRPRTARSAVPPRDRCPLGKPLFPARPRPGGRGGGSHETNSNSPDGGRMPTAQSRAGRPRSGGLRQVRAWIPGPRASCPRTARSAVPPRDRCPLGKPLFPARPRPGGRGGGSHETNSNSPDGGRMPTAQSRAGRPRSGGLRQVRAWIPGPRASCPRTARSAVPPRDRCPLGKPLFPARPRPGGRGGGSHERYSESPGGGRMPTAQSRARCPRSGNPPETGVPPRSEGVPPSIGAQRRNGIWRAL